MPVEIFWNLVEVPDGGADPAEWLSPEELARYRELRFPKRKAEWLAGRRAARQLLLAAVPAQVGSDPRTITVVNEPEGAPLARVGSEQLEGCLSLTHRGAWAAAAWTRDRETRIGIDLELVEPREEVFVRDYFCASEIEWVASLSVPERDAAVTLIWSAKETALKALRKGLRLDTRAVEILRVADDTGEDGWIELGARMTQRPDVGFRIWYRHEGESVLTLGVMDSSKPVVLRKT